MNLVGLAAPQAASQPKPPASWRSHSRSWGRDVIPLESGKDAADSASEPNHLTTETLNRSLADTLNLRLAPDGGFVAQLAPKLN
jgi:hypothetical protein